MKKTFSIILVTFFLLASAAYAKVTTKNQMFKAGHWIYDAMYTLGMEQGRGTFLDVVPATVSEIEFYFNRFDKESLSESGKELYDKVDEFLHTKTKGFYYDDVFALTLNGIVNTELYAKTNWDIPWSFRYNLDEAFLTAPVIFGFSDYLAVEADLCFSKNYFSQQEGGNFCNIPLGGDQFDFLLPRTAYGSVGTAFDKWGINVCFAKEGLQIGRTLSGSIVYNNTFETDSYFQFNVYCPVFKYNLDVVQVDIDKFMYLHQAYFNVKRFKLSVLEGSLVNGPFELRFLNPLMIMHSFAGWEHYGTEESRKYYGESNFCAYLSFLAEYFPGKYSRIYGLMAQNEIQLGSETSDDKGRSMPNSLGFQIGCDFDVPGPDNGYWKAGLEGVYTMPWLYMKHGADWSLYKSREDMFHHKNICSWIGTPYGPDCFGLQMKFGYEKPQKWSATFGWNFVAHGDNRFSLFEQKRTDSNGKEWYNYYPAVKYEHAETPEEQQAAIDEAENIWLSGSVEFMNQAAIKGTYTINDHVKLSSQIIYTFIINAQNEEGRFEHGFEFSAGAKFTIL